MPSRRTHRKSRHGCVHCKRRRVKCDEKRPQCDNCKNRGLACEYQSTGSLVWPGTEGHRTPFESSVPEISSHSQGEASNSPDFFGRLGDGRNSIPAPELNVRDLELMVQWCTSTYEALSRDSSTDKIWRGIVPREALAHPFLMHAILALSALHLFRQKGLREYAQIALSHQTRALELFRPLLGHVNGENCNAMFAASSIIMILSFAYPEVAAESDFTLAPVDDLLQVIHLSRGMHDVLKATTKWVTGGELAPLFKLGDYTPGLPEDSRLAFERLRNLNETCAREDPNHETEVYSVTIQKLESALDSLHNGRRQFTVAIMWAIGLEQRYLEFLAQRKPLALVVLAHYCIILHRVNECWWLEGWGLRVTRAIWKHFDPAWRPAIVWVKDVIKF